MATENNNKNLNVPNLRFPEFSGEWESCSLGEITTNFSRRNKEEVRYPMFSVTNNRGFVPQSEQFEDREMVGEDIKAYKIIHKNDFAYNPARINVGSIAKYNGNEPCMISSLYVCFTADKRLDNEWLIQLLKTPKMNFYYNINGEGGVRVYLFYPNFARIKTAFPSLQEQQKISSLLALLDERIATQIKIIEKLESLIRGIVETHYSNCQHKTKVKIADLGTSFTTMNMSKEDLSNDGNECVLYGELFTTYGCVINSIKSRTQLSIGSSTISQKNDLLFPASTTVDAMSLIAPSAISKDGVILGGDLFGIHISKDYDSEYLSYLINYIYKSHLARFAQGSTIIHLHYSDIKNAIIELPSLSEQKYLASLMREVESKIVNEKNMLSKLEVQKAYLLSHLFI